MSRYTPTSTNEAFQQGVRPAVFLTRVREILADIGYRDGYDWQIGLDGDRTFVQLLHWREDVNNPGVMTWGMGGKRYLSPHMTVSEIVRAALSTALAYEEHEVRESFTYKGARVFGPHLDVEALVEVADRLDVRS